MSINLDGDRTQCEDCRVEVSDTTGWTTDDYGGDYCPKCQERRSAAEADAPSDEEVHAFFNATAAESENIRKAWAEARRQSIGFELDTGTLYATPHLFKGQPATVVFTWSFNDSPVSKLPSTENECGRVRLTSIAASFLTR